MMRSTIVVPVLVAFVFSIAVGPAHGWDHAAGRRARLLCNRIDRHLPRYRRVQRSLQESTEGGTLNAYFARSGPRKLEAVHYGEMGRMTERYYFWQQRLFYAEIKEERYDRPIGANVKAPTQVVRTTLSRYYVHSGKVHEWPESSAKGQTASSSTHRDDDSLLADARRLLSIAQNRPA